MPGPELLALALLAAPPGLDAPPATPPALFGSPGDPLRLSAGFETGQLDAGAARTDHRRVAHLSAEWLGAGWRAGLGYRFIGSSLERDCTPVAGQANPGGCAQGGASGLGSGHELALSGGLAFRWAAASAGAALVHRDVLTGDGADAQVTTRIAPVATLRLGPPDLVCLRAAWHEVGPEVPGAGEGRAGLELAAGEGRLFAGVVREAPAWGVLLAGQVPLGAHLALLVSGAAHPTDPAALIQLGAGFVAHFAPDVSVP